MSSDRIVEISVLKINPNGIEEWMISRINPEMPIPPKSTEIHGITDADVANAARRQKTCNSSRRDSAEFNATKFDIPVLAEEFRLSTHLLERKYVISHFHKKEQRTLRPYKFYCGKELRMPIVQRPIQATCQGFQAQLICTGHENDENCHPCSKQPCDFAGPIIWMRIRWGFHLETQGENCGRGLQGRSVILFMDDERRFPPLYQEDTNETKTQFIRQSSTVK